LCVLNDAGVFPNSKPNPDCVSNTNTNGYAILVTGGDDRWYQDAQREEYQGLVL